MARKKKTNPTSIALLSVDEVARRFSFHRNTVLAWVSHDGLRCYRGPRGKIFIREDDATDFVLRNYAVFEESDEN